MFGYVMPLKDELKIREYEVFKAYYCGLCNEIGKKSQISRMTLTYDMTFLGLLLSSIYSDKEVGYKRYCPFKMKKVTIIRTNPYLEYAADMNRILSNRKLIDDYNDDNSILSLIASKFINTNKLSTYSEDKIKKIDYNLRKLNELEKSKCNNIDEVGHYFGNLTSEIFNIKDDKVGKILSVLGYNLGKWIYTMDAFEDLEKDIKERKYNPFIYDLGYRSGDFMEFKNSIKDNVNFTMIKCLDEICKAFEILDIKKNRGIIENIIYIGMRQKTKSVIAGGCDNDKSIRNLRNKGRCYPGGN